MSVSKTCSKETASIEKESVNHEGEFPKRTCKMGDVCTDTSAPAHYFPTCILVERFQEGNKKDKKSTA